MAVVFWFNFDHPKIGLIRWQISAKRHAGAGAGEDAHAGPAELVPPLR